MEKTHQHRPLPTLDSLADSKFSESPQVECLIIDHKASNHSRLYVDANGGEYGFDNIESATPFASFDAARQYLTEWDAAIDSGAQRGYHSEEWAEIVEYAQVCPSARIITAYRVDGIHNDESGSDILYLGCDKVTAEHVLDTATRSHPKGGQMTTFEFPLLSTESMPDGHSEWLERWSEGEIIG